MLRSFRSKDTEAIFQGFGSKKFKAIELQAKRRLDSLAAATSLKDLGDIRSNRLEALRGDRAGRYSVRINDQWRICFLWKDAGAWEVEIVDYH